MSGSRRDTARIVLDAGALARLRELDPDGRHGVLPRVLTAFEVSLSRMLTQLSALRGDVDASVMLAVAHTLKSSSASVGAMELARTCAEVESRLRIGDTDGAADDLERLIEQGEAARDAVAAMLIP